MYAFDYQRPTSRADAAAAAQRRRALPRRRPEPGPGDEAAAGAAERLVDLGGIAELQGHQGRRQRVVIGAMTTHAAVAASADVKKRDPGARRARRRHRRPDGAQHGHDRRLDRERRSGGRLSGRPCWASARRCTPTSARSPADEFFKGLFETALAARRADHRGELPDAAAGRLREVQAAGVALRAGRRVRGQTAERRARRRDGREEPACSAPKAIEEALAKSFTPDAAKAVEGAADGHQQRPARLAEYRAAMIGVMASRAVAAALVLSLARRGCGATVAATPQLDGPRVTGTPRRHRRAVPRRAVGSPSAHAARLGRCRHRAARAPRTTSPTGGSRPRCSSRSKLQRPLFLEGEAGVGKTELAKVLARALDTALMRLQCYEGLDIAQAAYEWNIPRQMIEIRLAEAAQGVTRRASAPGAHDSTARAS